MTKRDPLLDPVLPVDWQAVERRGAIQTYSSPEPVQEEPTGPALGNYPYTGPERRSSVSAKVARLLRRLARWVER